MPTPAEFDAPAGGEGEAVRRPGLEAVDAAAAAEGIAQLGSQIQQLLTMRERLVADGRELLATYERQLRELEREDYAEVQSALASLLSPTVSTSSTPGQDPGVSPRPAFFEGTVAITVGGAQRIQTIQVVEDSLSRVRQAEQVYIRRWHAGALLLEVTLAAGVELIGELNRVLPFPFAVQSATGQQIVLTLEGER